MRTGLLLLALVTAMPSLAAPPSWKQIDALVRDQKLEAASAGATSRLDAARRGKDPAEWARALVRVVQLRIGLHGYETAVRFLREQPWPKDPLSVATLQLFQAATLQLYVDQYAYEIRQREKVLSRDPLDLKSWTLDDVQTEIHRVLLETWKTRQALGEKNISELSEYLEANNYPPGVRDTLRDAVTYRWVEQLSRSSSWRPEHSHGTYALSLPSLLADGRQAKLEDPAVHPLEKLVALLDDLEAWHRGRGELEATLEARLARLRALHEHFTRREERALLWQDLDTRLPTFRQVPWYAMGKFQLASWEQLGGDLVASRRLAVEGAEAYPTSLGGQKCAWLVKELEASDYQMQAMASDGAGKRSIEVTHRNLKTLYFRAYAVDLAAWLARAKDYNSLPDHREVQALLRSGRPSATWTTELPQTADYQPHRTFVSPPLKEPALYAIVASTREDFGPNGNTLQAVNLIVTDLVALISREGARYDVTVVSGETGAASPGVEVQLYRRDYQRGHQVVARATSDKDGRVSFSREPDDSGGGYFVVARSGASFAFAGEGIGFYREAPEQPTSATLVYTDRSIYRPLQKIAWKAVAYRGTSAGASYQTLPNTPLTLELLDPNGERVARVKVKTNAFGSAAGELVVPAGRLLGSWQLSSSLGGGASIQVEEYKRPTFEVTFRSREGLRLNKPAVFRGEAKYYFGLPVAAAQVRWRATRVPVQPWWWGWHRTPTPPHVVGSGVSATLPDGSFEVSFLPSAPQPSEAGLTYRYELTADVTDEGGETRSASHQVRLGQVAVEARAALEGAFLREDLPSTLPIVRSSLDGEGRAGKGTWRLLRLQAPAKVALPSELPMEPTEPQKGRATPGDRLRPRWDVTVPTELLRSWSDGAEVAKGELTHDGKGEAKASLPALKAGAYRLRYRTLDEHGSAYDLSLELIVAGARSSVPLAAFLGGDRTRVRVGERARIFASSGIPGQPYTVSIYRGGKLAERRVLVEGRDSPLLELPVDKADRGGISVALTLVRDFQVLALQSFIEVPFEEKELKVELATFRDRLRPGQKETWRFTVKDYRGKPVDAGTTELLAYMYDRSLDAFAPHAPPSVLALYPQRRRELELQTSLGGRSAFHLPSQRGSRGSPPESLHEDAIKLPEGGPIGGFGRRRGMGGEMRAAMGDVMAMDAAAPAPQKKELKLAAEPPPPAPSAEIRTEFAETAFWRPQLRLNADGSTSVEFTVPDSVTSWTTWVHALTRELAGGSLSGQTRTVKELMVRPYLPRFLREGDQATLQVVVTNASSRALEGELRFDVEDADTGKSVLAELKGDGTPKKLRVAAGQTAPFAFAVTAPPGVRPLVVRVSAVAGELSDGELRPLPVLPARMHLVQSRFVALRKKASRTLTFPELAKRDDPSRIDEQLVVTVEGQLFDSVLRALPYLATYPHECTEQTLNRFVSTGILASLFRTYPTLAARAKSFAARKTPMLGFDGTDPNRKLALEESPWLVQSRGGSVDESALRVLEPTVAEAQRASALAKLAQMQTASGGFPWFPGGPPSPYMTLYLVQGLSRAAELKVEVPKEMVQRAWSYLADHVKREELVTKPAAHLEILTFLNYVASSFPDASFSADLFPPALREQILERTFPLWRKLSPQLKGMMALTLQRMRRPKDAALVFDSVMDSAKTDADLGTYWAPEDRAWLWYNDQIESHAFALRAMIELRPTDARREGLVQWLLLNKKLNQWKSTRATAEVIYALVKYLSAEKQLEVREETNVTVGSRKMSWVFEPGAVEPPRAQLVIAGKDLDPATMSTVRLETRTDPLQFASATWHFSTERLPSAGQGDLFSVSRKYFRREKQGREATLRPLTEGAVLAPGDEVEVQLSLRAKHAAEYVHLRDPRAAGLEPENATSGYRYDLGLVRYEEIRDSGTNFFFEWLPAGEYTFKYRLRANVAGTFRIGPATLQSMYAPEFSAYSEGHKLGIGDSR